MNGLIAKEPSLGLLTVTLVATWNSQEWPGSSQKQSIIYEQSTKQNVVRDENCDLLQAIIMSKALVSRMLLEMRIVTYFFKL